MSDPISYLALADGTEVRDADGSAFGTVERVLQDDSLDLFQGLVVRTASGSRFVDSAAVTTITTGAVSTSLAAADVAHLPEPDGTPVYEVDADVLADDARGGSRPGTPLLAEDPGVDPGQR